MFKNLKYKLKILKMISFRRDEKKIDFNYNSDCNNCLSYDLVNTNSKGAYPLQNMYLNLEILMKIPLSRHLERHSIRR